MGPELGIVFGLLAITIIVSAVLVVTLKNIFHCALALIVCLLGVAAIFVTLNAEFLAAAQVLIYVGAVAILMIFAIMLTSEMASQQIVQTNKNSFVAFFVCAAFAFAVIELVRSAGNWVASTSPLPADNTMTIGKSLMTHFMLPFEVVSVLMLAALIGAVVLAREEKS